LMALHWFFEKHLLKVVEGSVNVLALSVGVNIGTYFMTK
jgi:hypothetical protein